MIGLRLIVVMLALLFTLGAYAADEPIIRVRVQTTAPFVVGQPIALEIQILAPNFFLSAPSFPTLDIPGAIVTSDDRALNFTETVAGVTYSGIRMGYSIIPQQPGGFSLPPVQIDFSYAAVPGQSTVGSVTVPAEAFEVTMPAGAAPRSAFEIMQSFDRDIAGLKAGDALTRTVTIRAPGRPAMTIPPPQIVPPAGVKLYRHDPVLSDDRQNGQRIDRVTYEFLRAGDYVLPPVLVDAAGVPEVRIHVAATPASNNAIAPEPAAGLARLAEVDWGYWLPRGLGVIVPVILFAILWRRYGRVLRNEALARWDRHRHSEPVYFSQVVAACRTGDDAMAYRALQLWTTRAGIQPLRTWAGQFGGAGLQVEIERLEQGLFAGQRSVGWTGRPLADELTAARKHWRGIEMTQAPTILPNLN